MSNCRIVFATVVAIVLTSASAAVAQSTQIASAGYAEATSPISATSASSSSAEASDAAAIIATPTPRTHPVNEEIRIRPFSRVAFGTKLGTLGWGGQIATPITRRINLRGGFDIFNLGYGLTSDGTDYYASAHLKSGTIQADIYPFAHGSFHVSPGVMIFKNNLTASLNVPGGNTFSVGDTDYTSDPNNPVNGTGAIQFGRTAMPMFTIGFGNMITRREFKHLSFPFELGAAYTGQNSIAINMQGGVCDQSGCGSANDPAFQQNVQQQQAKINEQMKKFEIYPIFTSGVTYRF
jgi:hypothetical protein